MESIAQHLHTALGWIGSVIHKDGEQALVLSNNSLVDKLYEVTNVNRDIDPAWVQEMRKEILSMHEKGRRMLVTVGIDCRDIKTCVEAQADKEQLTHDEHFRVRVYDGQHRLMAMSQLYAENPNQKIEFYVVVYLIENTAQEKELLVKLNCRREFTEKDQKVVDARKAFLDLWNEITGEKHENRLCVRNIRASKRIRDARVTEALSKMDIQGMKNKLSEISQKYYEEFRKMCENRKFVNSVVYQVIWDTKMYQLVCYYTAKDDSWLNLLSE